MQLFTSQRTVDMNIIIIIIYKASAVDNRWSIISWNVNDLDERDTLKHNRHPHNDQHTLLVRYAKGKSGKKRNTPTHHKIS